MAEKLPGNQENLSNLNPEKGIRPEVFRSILESGSDEDIRFAVSGIGKTMGYSKEKIEQDVQKILSKRAAKTATNTAETAADTAGPESVESPNPTLDSLPTRDGDIKELKVDDLIDKKQDTSRLGSIKNDIVAAAKHTGASVRSGAEWVKDGLFKDSRTKERDLFSKDPEKRKGARMRIAIGVAAVAGALAGVGGVALFSRLGQIGEIDAAATDGGSEVLYGDIDDGGEDSGAGLEYTADNIEVNYTEYLSLDKHTQYSIGLHMDMTSVETAHDGLMETAANMPEHAAQMAYAYLSEDQMRELGLDGLAPNELADKLHDDELRAELLNMIEGSDSKVEIVDGVSGNFYNWGAKPSGYNASGELTDTELVQFQTTLNNASLLKITDADGNVSYFSEHCKNYLTERPDVDVPIVEDPDDPEDPPALDDKEPVRSSVHRTPVIQNNNETFTPTEITEEFPEPDGETEIVNPVQEATNPTQPEVTPPIEVTPEPAEQPELRDIQQTLQTEGVEE